MERAEYEEKCKELTDLFRMEELVCDDCSDRSKECLKVSHDLIDQNKVPVIATIVAALLIVVTGWVW